MIIEHRQTALDSQKDFSYFSQKLKKVKNLFGTSRECKKNENRFGIRIKKSTQVDKTKLQNACKTCMCM